MATPMDIDGQDVDSEISLLLDTRADEVTYTTTLKQLADRSREDLTVRKALAQTEVLKTLVKRLESLPENEFHLDYEQESLRCIGNACAMNQEAIRHISALGFDWFTRYTAPSCPQKLQDLASAVLFNISAADFSAEGDDREQENPALKACFNAGIHIWLVRVLVDPRPNSLGIEDLIDMLFWISSSTSEEDSQLPPDTITQLLNNMQQHCSALPAEALGTLIESVVALLRPAKAQLAERSDTIGLFRLLQALEERISLVRSQKEESEAGDIAVLLPQASNLTWLLSDTSAEPNFAAVTRMADPIVSSCLATLERPSAGVQSEQLSIASSLVLGNALLNMPESDTAAIVRTTQLVATVAESLSQAATADLLHAASGLLTVLCRPRETREIIGDSDAVISVVEKLCKHEVPQIREAGVRLLKALGRDSQHNQQRLAAIAQSHAATQSQQHIDAAP